MNCQVPPELLPPEIIENINVFCLRHSGQMHEIMLQFAVEPSTQIQRITPTFIKSAHGSRIYRYPTKL